MAHWVIPGVRMALIQDAKDFEGLPESEKESRLEKYLYTQYHIAKLTEDATLQRQYELLLKIRSQLLSRFGKFIIIDVTNKRVAGCCDDLRSALETSHRDTEGVKSFIYQLPETV